jgi:serine/threonine protein kinase
MAESATELPHAIMLSSDQGPTVGVSGDSVDKLPPSPADPSVPGYELMGLIGRGGMGVVYKARQIQLNRIVALKMIIAGNLAGADEVARFQTEARAVASLQHANIVQIHEIGDSAGYPYFALEFVAGGSLAQALHGKPLPVQRSAQLVETLAQAMHYAHQRGIVHRDLKPGNVLLMADGAPKVADFGLAKMLEGDATPTAGQERTRTGAILGTPSYMAPEQAAGQNKEVGPAADVYALGAILYELLTGRPPFVADTALDTIMQVIHQEPVAPAWLQPKVPRDLNTICLKCLDKDPRRRYASAAELADDLRRYLAGEPIRARAISRWGRLVKWSRRRPTVAALTAAVLLLTVVGFALVTWQWRRAEHERDDAETARGAAVQSALAEKDANEKAQIARKGEAAARERAGRPLSE